MTYKDIPGYCDFHAFYEMILLDHLSDNGNMVEIGCFKGHSVAFMATKAEEFNKKIKIFAVDTFKGSPEHKKKGITNFYNEFTSNIASCGISDYIQPMQMDSVSASHDFRDETIDFCFIDGAHDYESVKADIEAWIHKIKVGGIIAGHDYTNAWPGVIKAVDESLTNVKIINNVWMAIKLPELK